MTPHLTIEASAGTGKTYRIINCALNLLLDEGIPIERILVVTFSEKAAAELRRRLREALREGWEDNSAEPPIKRQRRGQALQDLDRALITTIHGLCFRLLREYAFEAGQPLTQEVDQAGNFDDLFVRHLRRTAPMRYLKTGLDEQFRELCLSDFGASTIEEAFSKHTPGFTHFQPGPELKSRIAGIAKAIAEALAPLQHRDVDGTRQLTALRLICTQAATLPANEAWDLLVGSQQIKDLFTTTGGLRSLMLKNAAKHQPAHDLILEIAPSLRSSIFMYFSETTTRLSQLHRTWLKAHGLIDYRDMLLRTREVLERSPALCSMLRQRFHIGLIDEFQDTDPVQWDIFRRLFVEDRADGLILVGDPKQAIYGFRGADVHVFRAAFASMQTEHKAKIEHLTENYRTAPELVRALDTYFSQSGFPSDYKPVVPAEKRAPRRMLINEKIDPNPFHVVQIDEKITRGAVARVAYSAFAAREIDRLLRAGIVIEEQGVRRPLQPDDICVLYRGAKDEAVLCAELERLHIPFERMRQKRLLQLPEAWELLFVLQAIDRPDDPSALKKALLTPFFAYPPAALEEWKGFSHQHPIARLFDRWRNLAAEGHWTKLFQSLLEDSGRLIRAAGEPDGEAASSRLLALSRELSLLAMSCGLPLDGFLGLYRRQLGEAADLPASEIPVRAETEQSRVRVMTIHGAKGLEFPIVFVSGGYSAPPPVSVYRAHLGTADQGWLLDFTGFHAAKAAEDALAEEKRLYYVALTRAVYRVYLPNANVSYRNVPVGGFLRQGVAQACPVPTIIDRNGNPIHEKVQLSLPPVARAGDSPSQLGLSFAHRDLRFEEAKKGRIDVQSFTLLRSRIPEASHQDIQPSPEAVLGLREAGDEPLADDAMLPPPDEAEIAPGLDDATLPPDEYADLPRGARPGTLFHSLMEELDFAEVRAARTADDLLNETSPSRQLLFELLRRSPLRRNATAEMVEHDARLLMQMAFRTLRAPQELLSGMPLCEAKDIRREIDFWLPAPGAASRELLGTRISEGYLTGTIDLVVRHQGQILLFDYKTNRSPNGRYDRASLAEMIRHHSYDWQYLLYALALRRQCRKCPIGAAWIFTRGIGGDFDGSGLFIDPLDDDRLDEFEHTILPDVLRYGRSPGIPAERGDR